jgi:hypothetical protein
LTKTINKEILAILLSRFWFNIVIPEPEERRLGFFIWTSDLGEAQEAALKKIG